MANEAVIIELLGTPPGEAIEVTVSDSATIAKGTLMIISDPRTGAASSAAFQPFIGVAAAEKDPTISGTTLAVWTNGIFDMTSVSGASADLAVAGFPVELSGANLIRKMSQSAYGLSGATFLSGAAFEVGRALETASANEVIAVRIRK